MSNEGTAGVDRASDRMHQCRITSYSKIYIHCILRVFPRNLEEIIKNYGLKYWISSLWRRVCIVFTFFPSEMTKTSNKPRRKHASFVHLETTFHNFIPPGIPCHNWFAPGLQSNKLWQIQLDENLFFPASYFHCYSKNLSGVVLCPEKLNLCPFLLYCVYGGKFEVKEKKNNPKLAVNIIIARDRERN